MERIYQSKIINHFIKILSILITGYHFYMAIFGIREPYLHRVIHLTLLFILGFIVFSPSKGTRELNTMKGKIALGVDLILAVTCFTTLIYIYINLTRIETRPALADPLRNIEILLGLLLIVIVLEITRRKLGWSLVGIAFFFIIYTIYGRYVPGWFQHSGYKISMVIDHLVFTYEGIFGVAIHATSTYVFMFIAFGIFFTKSGAGNFLFDFSNALVGSTKGGPAKIAVIASAFFGMISGSPSSNVATTGSVTIPLMKRLGYNPIFAAAVEAVASTGGAILPPIMGSAVFIMAEVTGIPYIEIAKKAIIPGILYFLGVGVMVHLRACKVGIEGLPKEKIPSLKKVLKEGWYYCLPIIVLLYLLLSGFTLMKTALYTIACTIIVSWLNKNSRMGIKEILEAMSEVSIVMVGLVAACAAAGIIMSSLMLTGAAGKITSLALSLTGESFFLVLLMSAIVCIVFGMGIVLPAAYLLTATLMAPAMISLGLDVLTAHLFIVYFAAISAITPPVAVAAYVAGGIADCNPTSVGWASVKLGTTAYILPFMFAYEPVLLLQNGTIPQYIWAAISAFIGVIFLAIAVEGWYRYEINVIGRIVLFISALFVVYPGFLTDIMGFMCALLILAIPFFKKQKTKKD